MEKVLETSREELICRVGETGKRRMSGFLAFFLPKILRKSVETTETILLLFLPPFKIHCDTQKRR